MPQLKNSTRNAASRFWNESDDGFNLCGVVPGAYEINHITSQQFEYFTKTKNE